MPKTFEARALVALTLVAGLCACGSRDAATKPASQVAAKVNRNEISVHQINSAMVRYGGLPEAQMKQASQQVLEKLIDQEILVQKAIDAKLDRDPNTVQALEASRRQILAQAYTEHVAAAAAKPGDEQVQTFYAEHPELFRDRRVYEMSEVAMSPRPEQVQQVQAELARTRSVADLAAWLKKNDVDHKTNRAVKTSEQIPLEVLPRIHAAKDGQLMVIPGTKAILAVQVVSSQARPLTQQQAAPYIAQFMQNQQRASLVDKQIKQLRSEAKVEYVGDFAKVSASAETNGPLQPPKAAPAAPARAAPTPGGDYVEKGISGIR